MITVEQAVRCAANLLGLSDRVDAFFNGSVTETDKGTVDGLVECFNLVENELAMNYLPLLFDEKITVGDEPFRYERMQRVVLNIVAVFDEAGHRTHFQQAPHGLILPKGNYVVRYSVLPDKKSIFDSCNYLTGVSERLLAYGIAAEYCLHKGFYQEHAAWDKKYKDAVKSTARSKGSWVVKVGSWI